MYSSTESDWAGTNINVNPVSHVYVAGGMEESESGKVFCVSTGLLLGHSWLGVFSSSPILISTDMNCNTQTNIVIDSILNS